MDSENTKEIEKNGQAGSEDLATSGRDIPPLTGMSIMEEIPGESVEKPVEPAVSQSQDSPGPADAPVKKKAEAVEPVEKPAPSGVAKPLPEKKVPPVKKSPVIVPEEKYIVSSSPHLFSKESVSKIMWTVSACLAPAGLASIYIFGLRALVIILLGIISAVATEYIWQKSTGRKVTIRDGSAFLTGLLLAYNLSPHVDWWVPILGSAFAIIIVKQLFGGLGMNIFNPALAARGFLLASFPTQMTTWANPTLGLTWNVTTGPTPLDILKRAGESPELRDLFQQQFSTVGEMAQRLLLGVRGGSIGETSALLLILGGLYLIYKKYIDWQIPAVYVTTTVLFTLIFNGGRDILAGPGAVIIFQALTGGLLLGAFYMATDYVTIPATVPGRIVFALGCGILTGVIRIWGGYPEGVCYSILIMNAFTPLIDDKMRTLVYGTRKELKAA